MTVRNERKKGKDKGKLQSKVKEKILEALELPKEAAINASKLSMIDGGNLIIENYKGIVEYESDRIRVNTSKGIIKITGRDLILREITSENILINGEIDSLEFFR
ncbi:MAG TPA: sporulation protein YqfC [Clostridiaceae bacterium]|nr:sporulation protein YqfC [Clostridiaceae bacterium]